MKLTWLDAAPGLPAGSSAEDQQHLKIGTLRAQSILVVSYSPIFALAQCVLVNSTPLNVIYLSATQTDFQI